MELIFQMLVHMSTKPAQSFPLIFDSHVFKGILIKKGLFEMRRDRAESDDSTSFLQQRLELDILKLLKSNLYSLMLLTRTNWSPIIFQHPKLCNYFPAASDYAFTFRVIVSWKWISLSRCRIFSVGCFFPPLLQVWHWHQAGDGESHRAHDGFPEAGNGELGRRFHLQHFIVGF